MDDITLKMILVDENDTDRMNNKRKQTHKTKHFDIGRMKKKTRSIDDETENCSVGQKQQQNRLRKKNRTENT